MELTIRKATAGDAAAAWAIRNAAIRHACKGFYPDDLLEQWTAGEMTDQFVEFVVRKFYVAMVNGVVVGTGFINLDDGQLDAIMVRPDMTGMGIGKRIVAFCEDLGRSAGLTQLKLDSTLNAAPFYRRYGFVGDVVGVYRSPRGILLDCIPMTKWIAPPAQVDEPEPVVRRKNQSGVTVVFDVDGTLVDAADLDMRCFDEAFCEVTGFPLPGMRWQRVREFTATAIVREALSELGDDAIADLEGRIQTRFLGKLTRMQQVDSSAFPAAPGGPQLLADLQQSQLCAIAIATGCWRDTSRFKLTSAGYQLDGIPFVSSSDYYRRVDIILNAIRLAGGTVERAVYVGDQLWDYRAARDLGVRFIGVGREREVLRRAGAEAILEEFSAGVLLHSVLRS